MVDFSRRSIFGFPWNRKLIFHASAPIYASQALTNAALGTVEVDIMEYVAKVPPGGRPKKFKVEKKLAKSDTTVKLQLSISMDEDEEGFEYH